MTIYLSATEAAAAGLAPRGNKFGARRVYYCPACAVYHPDAARCPVHGRIAGGLPFDSGVEATFYAERVLLQAAGTIRALRHHTLWPLVVAGVQVGRYEDDCDWITTADGLLHVADVKSPATATLQAFQLHRNLMWALHRIKVEVILTGK